MYSWRRSIVTDGRGVKTTRQKTRFRSVRIYKICKEFTYRWKLNMWEHWQQVKWWHECRATSTTTCLVWPQTWCLWTLTRTKTEDSWVPWACLSVVSLLSCSCCPRLTVPCIHYWSHCGSSVCLIRLIVIAMSHAHVEWLSVRPLHLPHFPSLHSH